MSTGLCAEDFEVFLDRHSICPAVFQERLFQIGDDDWHLDFVTSEETLCWMTSNQQLYVWDIDVTTGSGLKQLTLPQTGFPSTSRLSCVFRDTDNRVPSALYLQQEGLARWWPSVALNNTSVDSKLPELNGEVPISVHLLRTSQDGRGPVFITLTSSGTFLTLACDDTGKMEVTRLAESQRRSASIRKRLSTVIFGPSSSQARTDFIRSLLIYNNDEPSLIVGISPKTLKAVDINGNTKLWEVEATEELDKLYKAYLEDTEEDTEEYDDVMTSFLDAQYYKGGILVLFTGLHSYSDVMKFHLVHISDIETPTPKFGVVHEVTLSERMAELYEVSDPNSYHNQVRLCIPKITADAPLIARTDGIMIIHANYVHIIYVPDELTTEGISLSQELVLSRDQRIMGYGMSAEFVFVMLTTGSIEKIRLIPKNFPKVHINAIVEMVEDMHRPDRGLGQQLYIAMRHFFDKNFGDCAAKAVKMIEENEADDLLKGIRMSLASVIGDLDIHTDDFLTELRDKKRFYDGVILFLKYAKILGKIVDAEFQESRSAPPLQGAEAITEFNERIAVMEHIFSWANNKYHGAGTSDEEDVLHTIIKIVAGPRKQVRKDDWKKMEYLTRIPEGALRCMENMRNTVAEFDSFDQRFLGFRLFCDLYLQISDGVIYARNTTPAIQEELGETRWTTQFAHVYPQLCAFLLSECELQGYSEQVKPVFVDYVVKLMNFYFREVPSQPNGDPILERMMRMGFLDQALDLAIQYKDFKIISEMMQGLQERQRQRLVDKYKVQFAEDHFEEYYLEYLTEQRKYEELLKQEGELARIKINEIDTVRWRRDIVNEDFAEAARTLQQEADREKSDFRRKEVLQAFAKVAFAAVDPQEEDVREEQDDCDLGLERFNYQKAIPEQLLKSMYHGDWEKPLSIEELLQMGFHVIETADCTEELFVRTIVYGGRLIKWDEDNATDYISLVLAAWKKVLSKTAWTQVFPHNFRETLFARVVRAIILNDTPVAKFCFPKSVGVLAPDMENTQQGGLITQALEKAAQSIQRFNATGIPPV